MTTINIILANVAAEQITLPDFQRGFVWKRKHVRDFFHSLYHEHPVGCLLTWLTTRNGVKTELILDGQQRITSLYGVTTGKTPKFFRGDQSVLKGLHFHVKEKIFEYYQRVKMEGNPLWFDVTKVMRAGTSGIESLINEQGFSKYNPEDQVKIWVALSKLVGILQRPIYVEQIADENKDPDVVVDIFNQINSSGTRLSKGDLALAKISAKWPSVRDEMRKSLKKWENYGYDFPMDWLLRCVNAVIHGEADFKHLHQTDRNTYETGLKKTIKHIDIVLNQISGKLGIDHDRVLFSKFSLPILIRHLELCNGRQMSSQEWNLILYWYLQTGIHGRYSSTTESKIRQDLTHLDGQLSGIQHLISGIGLSWGRTQILPVNFDSWALNARTYPILYWMTRVGGAQNFCDGIQLKQNLLGQGAHLNVHHIFPKARLYEFGYTRPQVNAVGNFCFLTAACNGLINAYLPDNIADSSIPSGINSDGYFYWIKKNHPEALQSHWIPMDEELWKIENYLEFLNARRHILANAANEHLRSLNPNHPHNESIPEPSLQQMKHTETVDEETQLKEVQSWMKSQQLPSGIFGYDLGQSDQDNVRTIIDLAWPNGICEGLDSPLALLLNESAETYQIVNQSGYQCFVDVESFKTYVESEIVGV